MAYIEGNRYQISMLPVTIEEYVSNNDPVRAYDAFIEALDLSKLGIVIESNKVGNPAYSPSVMLKLLVYGYSYGWRSSRKLERATKHNISFIWLTGGLKPDHKTIANFRRNNKKVLKEVLKQCVHMCMALKLIEGNALFLDGSKIRANASINQTKSKEKLKQELKKIEERIDQILNECEKTDQEETGSLVEMSKELKNKQTLQKKIQDLVKKMEKEDKTKINCTDPECVNTKGRQGSHAGYNAQMVVDEKYGLIVNTDVVEQNNDMQQFTKQIMQANDVLEKKCKTGCADAGYSDASDLEKAVEKGIDVIVPSQKQALHQPREEQHFSKDKFKYNKETNTYTCPEGKTLKYNGKSIKKRQKEYIISNRRDCKECKNLGVCTTSKSGRRIKRLYAEETKEKLEQYYKTEVAQKIYKLRKEKVELPFGHIKRNLNGGAFLLRGIDGVNAEMAVNATCFNIARMITIMGGVCPLIKKMAI
jgi:transposase